MYNLVAHKIIMFDIFRDVRAREETKFRNMWGSISGFFFSSFQFGEEKAKNSRK